MCATSVWHQKANLFPPELRDQHYEAGDLVYFRCGSAMDPGLKDRKGGPLPGVFSNGDDALLDCGLDRVGTLKGGTPG
ncbi:hypothetical protein AG1IA_08288 [Rhizoctonia solani AG-1 IA]|uniref:Uncharacterized protein n=1 Tax=Thanatephorus cucumeris (strain AG1-IA) TaxID=983506 RepID=L8WLH5_THACA|nr:hypothetical protein AG1IA_08288 [Rhizoctonia solani AG-1 IA]